MKRILVWLLFSLMLWGVPAFVFWIGVGVGSNLFIEQGIRKAQESIHASVETASEKIAPEVFFQEFLTSRSRRLLESPLRSSAFRTLRRSSLCHFHPVRSGCSCSTTVACFSSRRNSPSPIGCRLFRTSIRTPLTTDLRDPAEVLPEETFLCRQSRAPRLNLKARGAGALVADARASWAPPSDPDWAWFDWRGGTAWGCRAVSSS